LAAGEADVTPGKQFLRRFGILANEQRKAA
jgi:hypothetical protein